MIKGMAYTPFAIMASILVISFATSQAGTNLNNSVEPNGFTEEIEKSTEQTQSVYSLRSLQTVANISKTDNIGEFYTAMGNVTAYGEYNDVKRQDISIQSYEALMEGISGKIDSMKFDSPDISVENFTLRTESEVYLVSGSRNHTFTAESEAEIKDTADPLLHRSGYTRQIDRCVYDSMIQRVPGGNYPGDASARGTPLVNPDSSTLSSESSKSSKVVVADDIRDYNNDTVAQFAGYTSEEEPADPSRFNDNYVTGIEAPSFLTGQNLIIHRGAWKSSIQEAINTECYMPTSNIQTPSIPERVEQKSSGQTEQGVYTVLSVDGDTTSNIGYERINGSYTLVEIEGVSAGEGITTSTFRASQELMESEGLDELIR